MIAAMIALVPFVVNADGTVEIKNITVKEKSDSVVLGAPIVADTEITFDVKFKELNTFVKYEIVLENTDDEDYELVNGTDNSTSDYITYEYEVSDGNTIEPGKEKTVLVTISYKNEVPADMLDDAGMFKETKARSINLVVDDIEVPDTLKVIGIFGILLVVVLIATGIFMIIKNKKGATLIIIGIILLPLSVLATKNFNLKINSVVKVSPGADKYCLIALEDFQLSYHEFEEGTLLNEINEEHVYYHRLVSKEVVECLQDPNTDVYECERMDTGNGLDNNKKQCHSAAERLKGDNPTDQELLAYAEAYNDCEDSYLDGLNNSLIKDASYGCYYAYFPEYVETAEGDPVVDP